MRLISPLIIMAGPENAGDQLPEGARSDIPLHERIAAGIRRNGGVALGMGAADFRKQKLTDADGNPVERRSTFGE